MVVACRRGGGPRGGGPPPAEGEIKLLPFAGNPSVSLAADSSPYTGEPVVQGDAASLPLARGRLWGSARGRG